MPNFDRPTTGNPAALYVDSSPRSNQAIEMLLASGLPFACIQCEALGAPYLEINGEDIYFDLRKIKEYIDRVKAENPL